MLEEAGPALAWAADRTVGWVGVADLEVTWDSCLWVAVGMDRALEEDTGMADRELEAIGDTFQELEAFRELEAAAAGNELLRAEEGKGTDRVADKALLLEPAQQVDMTAADKGTALLLAQKEEA